MSNQIGKAHVLQFGSNVHHVLNQEGSMIRSAVSIERVTGKSAYFERMGRGTVVEVNSRHQDTPNNDTEHSRRKVDIKDYAWGDMIDDQDKLKMLLDPTSDYVKAAGYDLGIKMDKIIITSLNGNAVSTTEGFSDSNIALPASSIMSEDFGTGSDTNLTVEKLREARRRIMRHAGMIREPSYCVVNASALDNLLSETEVTSSDYNTVKALVRGDLDTFVGFKFIIVADGILPGTADGTDTDPVRCFAFTQSALKLGISQDVNAQVYQRGDKMNNFQVLAKMSIGAVRMEEERVQAIKCVQSA